MVDRLDEGFGAGGTLTTVGLTVEPWMAAWMIISMRPGAGVIVLESVVGGSAGVSVVGIVAGSISDPVSSLTSDVIVVAVEPVVV